MTLRQVLTDDDLIKGLSEYSRLAWVDVPENPKPIPVFFRRIEARVHHQDELNLAQLKQAIGAARYDDSIFENEEVDLYLLYLITQSKEIPFWQGITIYLYLIMLMEFTEKQPKIEGLDTIRVSTSAPSPVSVIRLVDEENKLTDDGKLFIERVIQRSNVQMGSSLSFQALHDALIQCPPSEQVLLVVDALTQPEAFDQSKILTGIPFTLYWGEASHGAKNLALPSFTFINQILAHLSPQPMQMKPVIGVLSAETVKQLHMKHQHPLSLYSRRVKKNVVQVHALPKSAYLSLVHDFVHVGMASCLSAEARDLLFKSPYLPWLSEVSKLKNLHYYQNIFYNITESMRDLVVVRFRRYHLLTPLQQVSHYLFDMSHKLMIEKARTRSNDLLRVDPSCLKAYVLLHKRFSEEMKEDEPEMAEVIQGFLSLFTAATSSLSLSPTQPLFAEKNVKKDKIPRLRGFVPS